MAKATKEELAVLEGLVDEAASGLPDVAPRKMFGCHGLFASGNVFALVWKEGRIGVRLPDAALFEKLMSAPGSSPWAPMPKPVAHWVLVPPAMHARKAELKKWLVAAHRLANAAGPGKPAKAAKRAPARQATSKPAARKRAPARS